MLCSGYSTSAHKFHLWCKIYVGPGATGARAPYALLQAVINILLSLIQQVCQSNAIRLLLLIPEAQCTLIEQSLYLMVYCGQVNTL